MKMVKKNILHVVISHLLLLSVFFVDTSSFAKEVLQAEDSKNEEIASILQEGINIIKDEIQRDEEVASHMILRMQAFRQLRFSLVEGIVAKEKLLEDLKLVLTSTLPEEIKSLQKTVDNEKKIVQMRIRGSAEGTKRKRKAARSLIEESIPSKKKILVFFEKLLSEF